MQKKKVILSEDRFGDKQSSSDAYYTPQKSLCKMKDESCMKSIITKSLRLGLRDETEAAAARPQK